MWLAVPLAVAEACSWCAGKYEFKFVVDGSWRVSKFCDVVETAVGGENNVIKVRSTATTGASASVGAPRHHRCADGPYGQPLGRCSSEDSRSDTVRCAEVELHGLT